MQGVFGKEVNFQLEIITLGFFFNRKGNIQVVSEK